MERDLGAWVANSADRVYDRGQSLPIPDLRCTLLVFLFIVKINRDPKSFMIFPIFSRLSIYFYLKSALLLNGPNSRLQASQLSPGHRGRKCRNPFLGPSRKNRGQSLSITVAKTPFPHFSNFISASNPPTPWLCETRNAE